MWPDDDPNTEKKKPVVVDVWHDPPPAKGKKISMTVMWGDVRHQWKVMTITNTTWYRPEMWLTDEIVAKCCLLEDWTVTCVSDDLWSNIFGFIGGKVPGLPIIP